MSDLMLIVPDPDGVDPQAMAERRRRKSRRRSLIWGAFLLLGLAFGTVYATGFASITGTSSSPTDAAAPGLTPPGSPDTNELSGLITQPEGTSLTWNWSGRWGSISSKAMYEVDLSAESGTYYTSVYLTDPPASGTFSDLQVQFRIKRTPAGANCAASDLTTPDSNKVMFFTTDDAQVTFDNLTSGAAGDVYCVGIFNYAGPPEAGKDSAGTFIRRPSAGAAPANSALPEFVATLNKQT